MLSQPDNNIVFPASRGGKAEEETEAEGAEQLQLKQLPKVNLIFHFPDAAKARRKFFIF